VLVYEDTATLGLCTRERQPAYILTHPHDVASGKGLPVSQDSVHLHSTTLELLTINSFLFSTTTTQYAVRQYTCTLPCEDIKIWSSLKIEIEPWTLAYVGTDPTASTRAPAHAECVMFFSLLKRSFSRRTASSERGGGHHPPPPQAGRLQWSHRDCAGTRGYSNVRPMYTGTLARIYPHINRYPSVCQV